jgi:hypothetical protein
MRKQTVPSWFVEECYTAHARQGARPSELPALLSTRQWQCLKDPIPGMRWAIVGAAHNTQPEPPPCCPDQKQEQTRLWLRLCEVHHVVGCGHWQLATRSQSSINLLLVR